MSVGKVFWFSVFDSCVYFTECSSQSTIKIAHLLMTPNCLQNSYSVCKSEESSSLIPKRMPFRCTEPYPLCCFDPPNRYLSPSLSVSKQFCSLLSIFFLSLIASCQNVLSELIAGNRTGHACPSLTHQWVQQMWQIER